MMMPELVLHEQHAEVGEIVDKEGKRASVNVMAEDKDMTVVSADEGNGWDRGVTVRLTNTYTSSRVPSNTVSHESVKLG